MEKKLHVLIIEDLPSDAELAKHQIKKVLQDHIVRVVETEKDFVQTLESFKPDIIVSDYKLPSFDGLSALKIAQKKAPFTPFIILTGSMNEDTAVACMKAGADDYVIKEHIKRLGPAILNAMKKKQIEFERNDAIISLRESEEKFREMANLLPQVVFETDINGVLTFANEQTFKIFGYSQEKIAHGFNVLQAIIPEDRERAKENIHNILYGKNMGSPGYTAIKKDGSKFPILIYSNPIMKNNKPVGMRGIIVDITERMQQEKEYKQLIDGMNDTAFVMNFDGKFVEVNETAVRVLGYTRDELLAMGPADIDPHMSAYDIGKLIMGIKSKSAKKQVFETQHRTKAGKIIPVEISSSPITYHGRFVILSIARDITERKKSTGKAERK